MIFIRPFFFPLGRIKEAASSGKRNALYARQPVDRFPVEMSIDFVSEGPSVIADHGEPGAGEIRAVSLQRLFEIGETTGLKFDEAVFFCHNTVGKNNR